MKISVITVCYNSAEAIADALHSVANQTWPDMEHIVVDGASTDGTQAVIGRHDAKVARVVRVCSQSSQPYDGASQMNERQERTPGKCWQVCRSVWRCV